MKRIAGSRILHQLWWTINTIPCKVCGSRGWFKTNASYMDGIECEYECTCTECEEVINYFAYGSFDVAFTRTEAVSNFISRIRHRWQHRQMWRAMRRGKLPPLRRAK